MEPKFVPKDGQVDYTNIRYAPVINCVLRFNGKILLFKRSPKLNFYPNYWNGLSGFLDDAKSIEEKAREEVKEEAGLNTKSIAKITRGPVLAQESEEYSKTWIIFPALVDVNTDKIKANWEAKKYKWFEPKVAIKQKLLPGFKEVLSSLKLI